jgi:site-specific DNA recombinase
VDVVTETASGGVQNGAEFSWEHRPVLLSLIERAQAGEYEILLVARLDRLSRDHATLVVLERRLERHGVRVVSVAEENGDGSVAEFIRGQLALVAQLERALIRDRVSAGKLQKKKLGRHVHGRVPLRLPLSGRHPPTRAGAHSAGQADLPRRPRRLDARPDRPSLNRDGIPSAQGGEWKPQVVRSILTNPV